MIKDRQWTPVMEVERSRPEEWSSCLVGTSASLRLLGRSTDVTEKSFGVSEILVCHGKLVTGTIQGPTTNTTSK